MRSTKKEKPPLSERLVSKRPTVWREAQIELNARVIELLVQAGYVTWEQVDKAYKLAQSLK